MTKRNVVKEEEVGDLFVTEGEIMVKLLPSQRVGSRSIRWFSKGAVVNLRVAAKDIAGLVGRVKGRQTTVKGLTVMTNLGKARLSATGLPEAVEKAGFSVL